MKQRIIWIDYIKAIAITIVIMLHIGVPNPFKTVTRSFIIPLFFILSGLFGSPQKYASYKEFWKQKTLRLLIPYFIFNVITYIYWLFIARHYGADANALIPIWKPLIGIFLGLEHWMVHCKPLWFLPCLMLTEWFFYLFYRITKGNLKLICIFVILATTAGFSLSFLHLPPLPYAIGGSLSMSIFYFIGYMIRAKEDYIAILQKYMYKTSTILWAIIWGISTTFCVWLSLHTNETKVFENSYGNLFFSIPAAIFGCISIITTCIILYKTLPPLQILQYIGTHTILILAFHLTLAGWIKGITTYVFQLPLTIYIQPWVQVLFTLTIVLSSIPICYLYDKIIKWFINS